MGQAEGMELQELPQHATLSDAVGAGVPFLHIEPPGANPLLCRVRKGYNMRFDRCVYFPAHRTPWGKPAAVPGAEGIQHALR